MRPRLPYLLLLTVDCETAFGMIKPALMSVARIGGVELWVSIFLCIIIGAVLSAG